MTHPPFVYHDGQLRPAHDPVISSHHNGWRLGEGLFETILVVQGKPWNTDAHLQRLRRGMVFYGFSEVDFDAAMTLAQDLIQRNGLGDGYLRFLITRRGDDAPRLGYGCSEDALTLPPVVTIQTVAAAFPPPIKPVSLWPSRFVLVNPAPCKTFSSLVYSQALRDARAHQATNALLLNPAGIVCETASGNLFWIRGGTLYTPSLDLPIIPGCVRDVVLSLWSGPTETGHFTPQDLRAAEAVFMTNVGGLIQPITTLKGPNPHHWPLDERVLGVRGGVGKQILF
ncbi:MAG: aminotransferase class IV [Alphaproteobacteria bacterium]